MKEVSSSRPMDVVVSATRRPARSSKPRAVPTAAVGSAVLDSGNSQSASSRRARQAGREIAGPGTHVAARPTSSAAAPITGPTVNPNAKAAPISAMPFVRFAAVVLSAMYA